MNRLFGTDGIRGLANQYPMTAEIAFNLGRSVGYFFRKIENRSALIGKDTRLSGDMLASALTAGLCASGVRVINAGIVPTPAVAYLTNYCKATMGIVISASHNPYYDNGIKFFFSNGYKINDNQEKEIEKIFYNDEYKKYNVKSENIGKIDLLSKARDIYIKYIMDSTNTEFKGIKYKMVFDCANGASSEIIDELFYKLNVKNFVVINNSPNGININHKCGSTCLSSLKKEVIKEKADLGFAFDGDADRVLAVDEKGQTIDGDQMMFIYANAFLKEGKLGNNIIISTYMSNLGFDETIKEIGGKVMRTDVGDKHVLKKMIEEKSLLGGEQSGHIIFLRNSPNGDGIATSLQILDALSKSNKNVSIQAARMKKYYQKLMNFDVNNKTDFLNNKDFKMIKKEIENNIQHMGRLLIRPSGTENKIRILLESKDKKIVDNYEKKLNEFMSIFNANNTE